MSFVVLGPREHRVVSKKEFKSKAMIDYVVCHRCDLWSVICVNFKEI